MARAGLWKDIVPGLLIAGLLWICAWCVFSIATLDDPPPADPVEEVLEVPPADSLEATEATVVTVTRSGRFRRR